MVITLGQLSNHSCGLAAVCLTYCTVNQIQNYVNSKPKTHVGHWSSQNQKPIFAISSEYQALSIYWQHRNETDIIYNNQSRLKNSLHNAYLRSKLQVSQLHLKTLQAC